MKALLFIIVLITACQSMPALAAGSYYDWDSYYTGRCYEFTDRGQRIQQVPLSYCRRSSGSYYDWDSYYTGRCYEFTNRGQRVRQMPLSSCRQSKGSYYDWDSYYTGKRIHSARPAHPADAAELLPVIRKQRGHEALHQCF
jgi:hypothetical protein